MKIAIPELARRLESSLGAVVSAPGPDAARVDGVAPGLLAHPDTSEQLATIVRLCAEANASMIPWGGGTAMALGNPPRRADVVIHLGRLARIVDHDAANLTVSVEGGISIAALNSVLAAEKQRVSFDPPFPGRATVGGTVAANMNGPGRAGHGAVRDLVIGIKAILPGGESIKAGGKVVKNVAGYDMSKLFVGSLGTLGVITEATLRVRPIAEAAATLIAEGDLAAAEELIRELTCAALLPTAVFLCPSQPPRPWQVVIHCEGFGAAVMRQLQELEALARRAGMRAQSLGETAGDRAWDRLRDLPLLPGRVMVRVTQPRSRIFEFLDASRRWDPVDSACDALTGTIWLALPPAQRVIGSFQEIAGLASRNGGHAVLFTAPPALKRGVDVWGNSPASFGIMRAIKRQFDPVGLLNPGRFLGGL